MFVKYNGVLRGLDSEVAFLRDEMVRLCCSAEVAAAYGRGALEYTRARSELNTYTTTLHAINSAIVKLSKLTRATTVYRGISGRVLPDEFWHPNEFGVKGGVEAAFMSTTTNREVALGRATATTSP